jgi:hypothetical protein
MDLARQAWQGWMRTGGLARLDRGGEDWRSEIERDVIVLDKIQEDHEFIVTRATTAIAQPPCPVKLQSVWVLTTHVTHSNKYRRSSYFPSLPDKQRKQDKQTNTSYIQKG